MSEPFWTCCDLIIMLCALSKVTVCRHLSSVNKSLRRLVFNAMRTSNVFKERLNVSEAMFLSKMLHFSQFPRLTSRLTRLTFVRLWKCVTNRVLYLDRFNYEWFVSLTGRLERLQIDFTGLNDVVLTECDAEQVVEHLHIISVSRRFVDKRLLTVLRHITNLRCVWVSAAVFSVSDIISALKRNAHTLEEVRFELLRQDRGQRAIGLSAPDDFAKLRSFSVSDEAKKN